MARKFGMHGIFRGLNFDPGILGGGGLFEALGIFLVLIFVPVRSSLSLEIRGIPPPDSQLAG